MDQFLLDVFIDMRMPWSTPIVIIFTMLTGPTLVWIYSVVVGVVARKLWIPVAVGVANVISHIVKRVVDRPRPDVAYRLVEETNASLPSGHAVGAAAFAMVISLLVRRWWVLILWVLALLIGLSRLYVGVHWPSDLFVGWMLGALVVFVIHRAFSKLNALPRDIKATETINYPRAD